MKKLILLALTLIAYTTLMIAQLPPTLLVQCEDCGDNSFVVEHELGYKFGDQFIRVNAKVTNPNDFPMELSVMEDEVLIDSSYLSDFILGTVSPTYHNFLFPNNGGIGNMYFDFFAGNFEYADLDLEPFIDVYDWYPGKTMYMLSIVHVAMSQSNNQAFQGDTLFAGETRSLYTLAIPVEDNVQLEDILCDVIVSVPGECISDFPNVNNQWGWLYGGYNVLNNCAEAFCTNINQTSFSALQGTVTLTPKEGPSSAEDYIISLQSKDETAGLLSAQTETPKQQPDWTMWEFNNRLFYADVLESKGIILRVSNYLGQTILTKRVTGTGFIDLSHLPIGMYVADSNNTAIKILIE